jgi:hypothetical protein
MVEGGQFVIASESVSLERVGRAVVKLADLSRTEPVLIGFNYSSELDVTGQLLDHVLNGCRPRVESPIRDWPRGRSATSAGKYLGRSRIIEIAHFGHMVWGGLKYIKVP